jgi:hypothetical protein
MKDLEPVEEVNKLKSLSDDELVALDGEKFSHKQQGAHLELLRRNTKALKESSKSSDRYALNVLVLTIFIFAITGAQFMLDLFPIDDKWIKGPLGIIIVVGIIYVVSKEFKKD